MSTLSSLRIEPSNENVAACPICLNNTKGKREIKFEEQYEDLCERCSFVKDIGDQSVVIGLLERTGDRQDTRWEENDSDQSVKGNRWSSFIWMTWNDYRGEPGTMFELFCLPDSPKPFSDFPVKNLPETTASSGNLAKVQEWLNLCHGSHKLCQPRAPSLLPKRVLDVSLPQVRLYESHNEVERYVCLSHRWGNIIPACITTSTSIETNRYCIDWDAFPATFQDAIHFTRRLGLKYIWIDSVCIIQDDAQDWREQSALMANIYENAYVTLCATTSSGDDSGCYSTTPLLWQPQKVRIRKRDGIEYNVYIRRGIYDQHIPPWANARAEVFAGHFPLMTRGWCYQERLLSQCLVHFGLGELMWECAELSDCACSQGELGKRSPYMASRSEKRHHKEALYASDPALIEKYWDDVIHEFSDLSLTYEKDKLPALSGVAKVLLNIRPGDEYLAGLWKKTIVADLSWSVMNGEGRRPSSYRSPSWSWAAIDGVIYQNKDGNKEVDVCNYPRCVDVTVTPDGPDLTGQVSSGHIILDASIISTQLEYNPDDMAGPDKWQLAAFGLKAEFYADCKSDLEDGSFKIGDDLLCLRLANSLWDYDICLVLKQIGVDGTLPLCKRVGQVSCKREQLQQYWFPPRKENTLVKII